MKTGIDEANIIQNNAAELLRWFSIFAPLEKLPVVLWEEKPAVHPDPSTPVFRPTPSSFHSV